MFSDIHSIRSDPSSPRYSRNFRIGPQDIDFESEYNSASRVFNSPSSQRWKNMLLPEIDQKYNQIMRQRQGYCQRISVNNSPIIIDKTRQSKISRASKLSPKSANSRINPNQYEEKIEGLEEQN